ncbi:MAG TPA: hypothetical protein VF120_01050, partial [Ktedonobacterales bacterium]
MRRFTFGDLIENAEGRARRKERSKDDQRETGDDDGRKGKARVAEKVPQAAAAEWSEKRHPVAQGQGQARQARNLCSPGKLGRQRDP